jgi:lipopolysaccharide transport system permease protein
MKIFGFTFNDIKIVFNLAVLQIKDKYLGSYLGSIWGIVEPIIFLSVYTVVFTFIFKARIPGAKTSLSYSIWLLTGLVPWLAISESLTSATNSIVSATNIVKNISFKLELLPIVASAVSMFKLSVGLLFLLILLLLNGNVPSYHIIYLPLVIFIQLLFFSSIGFILGSLTVFIRDIAQVIPTILLIMIFATPIFYDIKSMSELFQQITFFNPLYQLIEPYRKILIYHQCPNIGGIFYVFILSFILFHFGLILFRNLKGFFISAL